METVSDLLETTELRQVATGFVFTEGPLWHPDGFFYFVDVRASMLYRLTLGEKPVVVRKTNGGNGTTFDLQGRLINCEGDGRRVTRTEPDGTVTTLIDRFDGKRLNRPNDVICASDGALWFTDPSLRVPLPERELERAAVYRIAADGSVQEVAPFEYPNGLALSPDERTLYVANTRWTKYIHAIEVDAGGTMLRRRIFADMSSDGTNGVPDGMKVDAAGRVFCTGTGGVWVFAPDGTKIGIIETP
jgi:gluconolactonase